MKVAVILSGCGVRDGSEIHEAVTLLLALNQGGHTVSVFAPDREQQLVIDHASGRPTREKRNILSESARIARGNIQALSAIDLSKFDAIAMPGGLGAVTNLCNFASMGSTCTVSPDVSDVLTRANGRGLILGFMCISPVIAARLFGAKGVKMTIGFEPDMVKACEIWGAKHQVCGAGEACVDESLRIVSTPAYMCAKSISECYDSACALVRGMESLAAAK